MSTPAHQPDASPDDLATQIRQELTRASAAGERPPGRPTLAAMTGASAHQVRKVLAELATESGRLAIVPTSTVASSPAPTVLVRQSPPADSPAPTSPESSQVGELATPPADDASDADPVTSTPPVAASDAEPPASPVAGEPLAARLVASADTLVTGWRRLRRAGAPADASPPAPADTVHQRPAKWGLVVLGIIAIPAFIATWAGWVGLGGLTGFGVVKPLPGIWDSLEINTAVTLPLGVEAYAFLAVGMWLSGRMPTKRARRFAMVSGLLSLALGMAAQVAYHLLSTSHGGANGTPAYVITAVACLPNTILGMASILAHLARTEGAR